MVNKSGQGVFLAAIIGLAAIIVFILMLPILMQFIGIGIASIDQPFTILLIGVMPVFVIIMIIWWIIAMARNQ
jgi:hypothetical protein